jgi:hypothetical protein
MFTANRIAMVVQMTFVRMTNYQQMRVHADPERGEPVEVCVRLLRGVF